VIDQYRRSVRAGAQHGRTFFIRELRRERIDSFKREGVARGPRSKWHGADQINQLTHLRAGRHFPGSASAQHGFKAVIHDHQGSASAFNKKTATRGLQVVVLTERAV